MSFYENTAHAARRIKVTQNPSNMLPKVVAPQKVTPALLKFAQELVGENAEPFFIRIRPVAGAQPERCHFATANQVAQHGGEQVFCWTLWAYKPFWFEADLHSVWRDTNGKLHDITPDPDGEQRRLIVLDPGRTFDGYCTPKKFMVLNKDPRVTEATLLHDHANTLRAKYRAGEPIPSDESRQIMELQMQATMMLMPFLLS